MIRVGLTAVVVCALSVCTLSVCVLSSAPPARAEFDYVPMWPFRSAAEASAAQDDWHDDPVATAMGFARDYLGFTGLDRATGSDVIGDEAWVGVGAALPDGRPFTAATVHLVRFGTGDSDDAAPWEVVGTQDTVLTLDAPRYGSGVGSVFESGGLISGVDESLHVQVRQIGRPTVVGEYCCLPAGGIRTPWAVPVRVDAAPGPATVVVSTGGHVALVERFAVTGVVVG